MNLARFVLRRAAGAVLFVLLVSSSALVLTRLAPGDAAADALGQSHVDLELRRHRLQLDRPVSWQLAHWLAGLARLDLGRSLVLDEPVGRVVRERAASTARLASAALVMAVTVALPVGLLTGAWPRGWLARLVTPLSIAGVACPPLVGALAILWIALETRWLPVAPGALLVPSLALALPLASMLERLQSQATRDALASPDLVAAAARGIPRARLLWVHVLRQSLRPLLGVFGIVLASLFSGSLAVEFVTSWPGLGRLTRDAIVGRDVYLVAGCAFAGAVLIAAGNLVADIARAIADPRVQIGV